MNDIARVSQRRQYALHFVWYEKYLLWALEQHRDKDFGTIVQKGNKTTHLQRAKSFSRFSLVYKLFISRFQTKY